MTNLFRTAAPFAIGLMIFLSIAIALHAFAFQLRVSGDPAFHLRFDTMPVSSTMHVIGGGIVLLLGGFQFVGAIRRRYPLAHRNMGRVYLVFVLVGGTGGLLLAPFSDGGIVAHFGFGILAILWLFSGWQAYAAIRRGDVATHRAWMLRNFAMTFGAVTLRLYLGIFTAMDIPFSESYPTVAWISWVPNLILIEWYLALTGARSPGRVKDDAMSGAAAVS